MEKALYVRQYLVLDRLNWKTFSQNSFQIWQGITLHRRPGHTDGSVVMELELPVRGTVVLTGDLFHVKENYEDGEAGGIFDKGLQ
jgi:glyoxylase-like metal-dependent hydrolase (beta-lactamase superfamily II)